MINTTVRGLYNVTIHDTLKHPTDFILNYLKTRGGATDLNGALTFSLKIAKEVKIKNEIPQNTKQMIVFLTDGNSTYGVTDR